MPPRKDILHSGSGCRAAASGSSTTRAMAAGARSQLSRPDRRRDRFRGRDAGGRRRRRLPPRADGGGEEPGEHRHLDACRNNPFERRLRGASRGLAAVDAARGTLIAYATAPGSVAADGDGAHGLYTEELLRALRVPGLTIEAVFKQVRVAVAERSKGTQTPWESSSLTGDLVVNVTGALRNGRTSWDSLTLAGQASQGQTAQGSIDADGIDERIRSTPSTAAR